MRDIDEFDDPKGKGLLDSIGLKAAFFIVLIALSFMVGLVWKIYSGGGNDATENVPIVRADTDDYKIRPDEPGGEEVKFKDSTIFASGDPDRRVENLLAESDEEPNIPRSQLFAGLNTDEAPEIASEMQSELDNIDTNAPLNDGEEQVLSYAKEAEAVVEELVTQGVDAVRIDGNAPELVQPRLQTDLAEVPKLTIESKPVPKVEPEIEVVAEKPKLQPAPAPKPKVAPKPVSTPQVIAPSVAATDDYFVQLVSVKSNEAAEAEWTKQVKKYGSLLSGQSHRVEKADLGAKGVYYRVQAGPMSKDSASSLCTSIKKQNPNGCLLKTR